MAHCFSCHQSRRAFLRTGLFGLGFGMRLPWVFEHTALAMASDAYWDDRETHPERIMVIVELTGGNDGLNTVVPYTYCISDVTYSVVSSYWCNGRQIGQCGARKLAVRWASHRGPATRTKRRP